MCVCVDCACPTGDWPPCDRPVLTEPARVPLLARCRTGAAAAGHLHSHALLPWDALVLPRRQPYALRQKRFGFTRGEALRIDEETNGGDEKEARIAKLQRTLS